MSASAYLTRTDLRELVGRDRAQRATVIAWLKAQRWRFVLDADGWPKVARAYHDARLGITDQPLPAAGVESEPDFSSLRRMACERARSALGDC